MYLYDGKSDISWFYEGKKTRKEMDGDLHYPPSNKPCVMIDNGAGEVYDWRYLSVMCNEYGVEFSEELDDYQPIYETLVLAIKNKQPEPTLKQVNEKVDENTLAIAELGVTTTQASNEQMLGMAEVGTMLSDIIVRLDKAGI